MAQVWVLWVEIFEHWFGSVRTTRNQWELSQTKNLQNFLFESTYTSKCFLLTRVLSAWPALLPFEFEDNSSFYVELQIFWKACHTEIVCKELSTHWIAYFDQQVGLTRRTNSEWCGTSTKRQTFLLCELNPTSMKCSNTRSYLVN